MNDVPQAPEFHNEDAFAESGRFWGVFGFSGGENQEVPEKPYQGAVDVSNGVDGQSKLLTQRRRERRDYFILNPPSYTTLAPKESIRKTWRER